MLTQIAPRRCSIPLVFLVVLGLSLLVGCAKQRANWYLKNAQKRVQGARMHEAERFSPTQLTNTETKIKEAQDNLAKTQFDAALDSARQAAEMAKTLLDETIASRANTLKTEAEKSVQIATDNQGQQLNEALYKKIQDANTAAAEALGKQKYEKTIKITLQVVSDVVALLQPLKQEAESNLADARKRKENLLREQAEVEAPGYVTDADKKIAEIDQLITKERQYRKANQVYRDTKTLIDEGINEALRSRSRKAIARLEKKLVRAINEEAETYTHDFLESAQQQYQDITKNYLPPVQDYRKVLDMANMLDPQLDELILQTRILASTAQLNLVTAAIRTMEENKVRTYLPGRLEEIDQMLATAKEQFQHEQYDECKKTCKQALAEKDQIVKAFDEMAASEIRAAGGKLDEASSVLEQMGNIFATQAPTSADPVEQSFEKSKQALKAVLDAMTRDCRVLLGMANVHREDSEFSNAIEKARLIVAKSNYIVRETFHTVAHNNVLEVANKITQVNLNGGAKFAQDEITKTKNLLEEARAMIREKEAAAKERPNEAVDPEAYRPAVAKTSEAKAALEVSVQRVTQSVMDRISKARQMAETAESNKAGVYALGDLSTAKQVIQEANELLTHGELFEASNKGEQGLQIASDANIKALRAWAQESVAAAEDELRKAEKAGADHYATDRYKEALNQLITAKDLLAAALKTTDVEKATKAFAQSKDIALASKQDAAGSRMEPVTEANQQIVKAKSYNAWEEEYPLVMQAIIDARSAIEAMEAGKYSNAKAYADKAAETAQRATESAQKKTYDRRVRNIANDLAEAAQQGGLYFNIEGVRDLMVRLQQIKEKAKPKEFETISADLDQFETDLYKLTETTPEFLKKMVGAEQALYDDLVNRGAREFADKDLKEGEKRLRFAELDFNKGDFRSSYDNLRKAVKTLGEVDLQYKERAFADDVRALFSRLSDNIKTIQPVLNVPTAVMHRVLDQPQYRNPVNAMFMGADPVKFRQTMDELYQKSLLTPYPVTMGMERKQFMDVFELARQASFSFEKFLILDQYDKVSAKEIVDKAYDLIDKAQKQQAAVSARFEERGLQGKLAELDHAIGY